MICLKLKLNNFKPANLSFIAGSLKRGQVLVLPTDTIYGLSALAENNQAIRRIYALKKRAAHKPLIILMSDLEMVKKYCVVSSSQEKQLKEIWGKNERPTTVILQNKGKLPKELLSSSGGLAIRLPKSIFLIKILKELKQPIVSTSLNLTGEASLRSLKKIKIYFSKTNEVPDLIVDTGYCRRTKASRLIDLRAEPTPKIIRK